MTRTSEVSGDPPFECTLTAGPAGTRMTASGELDLASAQTFREQLLEALAHGDVILDLSELRFMDSSGVAAIDAVLREPSAGRLTIERDLHDHVRRILEMTGMLGALPFVGEATREQG